MNDITSKIRSDSLVPLRDLFSEGYLAQFGAILQINVILDANTVIAELSWIAYKAKTPEARTGLIEAIEAETVIAHAPTYLLVEMEKKIPEYAAKMKKDPEPLALAWQAFKENIQFTDFGAEDKAHIDPKDAPYLKHHLSTGFAILTDDKHLERMGAVSISNVFIATHARDYSRNAAIEYHIKIMGLGSMMVTEKMITSAIGFIRAIIPSLRHVSPWTWLFVIGLFAYTASRKDLRNFARNALQSFPATARDLGAGLLALFSDLAVEHYQAQIGANNAKLQLEQSLNGGNKGSTDNVVI